jgi:hypothetical protein
MAGQGQCEYCGAVLLPEDAFCGECGAPRAEATSPVSPDAPPPGLLPAAEPGAEPEAADLAGPKSSTRTGWRAAFIALMVVGALVCLVAVLAFLFAGFTETEGWNTQENWLFSTFCCLLPIGGGGLVLLAAGAAIWFSRLREL